MDPLGYVDSSILSSSPAPAAVLPPLAVFGHPVLQHVFLISWGFRKRDVSTGEENDFLKREEFHFLSEMYLNGEYITVFFYMPEAHFETGR